MSFRAVKLTQCDKKCHMVTQIWVDTGWTNQWGPATIVCKQFHKRYLSHPPIARIRLTNTYLLCDSNIPEANGLTFCDLFVAITAGGCGLDGPQQFISNCIRNPWIPFQRNIFEGVICKMTVILFRFQCAMQMGKYIDWWCQQPSTKGDLCG